MTTTTKPKVVALIETVRDDVDEWDPDAMAARVVAQLSRGEYVDALRVLIVRELKNTGSPHMASGRALTEVRDAGRSLRWEAAANWWKRAMDQWVATETPGQRARLGDLTVEQVQVLAVRRQDQARMLAAEADRYARLAALMIEVGARTVSEVPEAEAVALWTA